MIHNIVSVHHIEKNDDGDLKIEISFSIEIHCLFDLSRHSEDHP